MKRRIASMILTSVLVAVIGCNASTASTSNVSCSMTCNNISIINDIKDNIHVYHSKTKEDFDRLTSIIENRIGRIIIEMVDATVLEITKLLSPKSSYNIYNLISGFSLKFFGN